ncbi:MAG: substrate-binding domain-containing protein [Actinobacteria bacterium]|nr:substrate-binding domain-containing protein [Actinomycetota bacterium]
MVVLSLSMVAAFSFSGCKKEAAAVVKGITLADLGFDSSKYSAKYANDPDGNPAVSAYEITLTDEEIAKVKEGSYTAAILWAGAGECYEGLTNGIKSVFDELGIKIILESDSQYDVAKEATDVETTLALNPDIIIAMPVDPVSAAEAFKAVVDKGIVLVFEENIATGYHAGEQYVSMVSGDSFGIGRAAADIMNEALGGKGNVGFIYHDADFFVTNNRDRTFVLQIEQKYPDIKIVAASGFVEESKAGEVATVMLKQHPEINAFYVAWAIPAIGVLEALRSAERNDIKIVTIDLDPTTDLNMISGGSVYGKVTDLYYDTGIALANASAYALIGKEAPPFAVVDLMKVNKDNMIEAWDRSFGMEPPDQILEALKNNQ